MIHKDHGHGVRKVLALAGTAALVLVGSVAFSSAAQAVDPPPPSIANIVAPGDGGSIIVHKHAGAPGEAGNGTPITDPTKIAALGVTVDGVTFRLDRISYDNVPIDLSTVEGWDLIWDTMTPADITGNYSAVLEDTQVTAGGGLATFSGLEMGLYLATESGGPAGITLGAPFLVTVPFPDPAANSWIYDVNVYPKNQLSDNPSKTVSDPIWVKEGDEVTWTLNVPVPRPPASTTGYTVFDVTDSLDPRLDYVADSVVVTLNGATVPDTDYTVTDPMPGAPPAGNNDTLTVSFDVEKIITGQTYVITFDTEVNGSGVIPNTAVRNVNGTVSDIGTENVNFGKVKVIKKRTNSNLTLQGAEFELWKGDKSTKLYGPTATDSNGEITFAAIGLGKGEDKTEQVCLKETVPPPGYSISGDGWTCLMLDAAVTDATVTQPVDNPPRTTPNLPLTGASGTAVFMVGGLALLAAAAGAALIVARRRNEATNRR